MAGIKLPKRLEKEFESVRILTESTARTRRVDALLLAWIKYEKQLNRLLYFLIFTHRSVKKSSLDSVISCLSTTRYERQVCMHAIRILGGRRVKSLVSIDQRKYASQIEKISSLRNKFAHGSYSGQRVSSREIVRHLKVLLAWIDGLAQGADSVLGYDGLAPGPYRAAKKNRRDLALEYPFNNIKTCMAWISNLESMGRKK